MGELYDLIVLGAGPAGLTAAIYAARFKLKTLVLGEMQGGTITEGHRVENWPGEKSIAGIELGQKFVGHAKSLGVEMKMDNADKIAKKSDGTFEVHTTRESFNSKKLLLAIGTQRRTLGLPHEKELQGKGVSYCATCDAAFFFGKVSAVVGGGNPALSAALLLAESAEKVYIIHRREEFAKADPVQVDLVNKNDKIEAIFKAKVAELRGEEKLESIVLDNGNELRVSGLFVEIGTEARREFLEDAGIDLDDNGYVKVDSDMRTSSNGIYSAGDLNSGNFKQAIVAAAEGAIAARTVYLDLKNGQAAGKK